jgi:hypothetical protein
MSQEILPPPPIICIARRLYYAILDESVGYSGRTSVFRYGVELGRVPCLAICKDGQMPDFFLFYCDREWDVLACAGHPSVDDAMVRVERTFPGSLARWIDAQVSEEEGERLLDELWADERCSVCGKRMDLVDEMAEQPDVRWICDRCLTGSCPDNSGTVC